MRAFVHAQYEYQGKWIDALGTGVRAGMVTPEYKSIQTLKRYFLRSLPDGRYHVEAFYNFTQTKFGTSNIDKIYQVTNNQVSEVK